MSGYYDVEVNLVATHNLSALTELNIFLDITF